MSNYLDEVTLSNAFCYLINYNKKYSKNEVERFRQSKFDEIMKSVEQETDKFNGAELIYVSESLITTSLITQDSNLIRLRQNLWNKIKNKAKIKLPNYFLLAYMKDVFIEVVDPCKRANPPSYCKTLKKLITDIYLDFSTTANTLRDNDILVLISDRQDDSFSSSFKVNARRSFRVNARIVMSDDRDLEAEKEKIDIMWDSYKEYIIKFWEELE
jgi:hypothetical protein